MHAKCRDSINTAKIEMSCGNLPLNTYIPSSNSGSLARRALGLQNNGGEQRSRAATSYSRLDNGLRIQDSSDKSQSQSFPATLSNNAVSDTVRIND